MNIRYMVVHPYNTPKFLKKGITEIYLPLPLQKLKSIQIQPGKQHGVFCLRSAEIFEFSNNPDTEEQQGVGCVHQGTVGTGAVLRGY